MRTGAYGLLRLAILTTLLLIPAPSTVAAAHEVAEPFRAYYDSHEGIRVLGYPLSDLMRTAGFPSQYFEKGRIEDHRQDVSDASWAFMYGRLTAELIERDPQGRVNNTDITYAALGRFAAPKERHAPPPGFKGGTMPVHDGIFVPYHAQLQPAPGYIVAPYFWAYITRSDLFPGGWLHDIGLPMSDTFTASTVKSGQLRTIFMQSFERTVLTYDMQNPAGWQVERGNIGADALRTLYDGATIEIPAPGARSTLPLHLLARGEHPGEQLFATLRWQDGTRLTQAFTSLHGEDGMGLLIGNLDWMVKQEPPQRWTQHATLEISNQLGRVLARQETLLVDPTDPSTQDIALWFVLGEELVPVQRRILRTERVASVALEELLWGPAPRDREGLVTLLPTPEQVLAYPGRENDWGSRVRLLGLAIDNGVATANFSRELRAYGGGSLRVMLIRQQITRTLLEFPSVREVRIAIEGQTEGVLEP